MAIGDIIVGIDIGFSRASLVIGEVNNFNQIEVIETAIKSISIPSEESNVDDIISDTISSLVKQAEDKSGFEINSAYVTVPGEHINIIQTEIVRETKDKYNGITQDDIIDLIEDAKSVDIPENSIIIEIVPYRFVLDDNKIIEDPIGKFSNNIVMLTQVIVVKEDYLEKMLNIFRKADLHIDDFVPTILAEKNVILEANDFNKNNLILDFGTRSVEAGIFAGDALIYAQTFGFGGDDVIDEIARRLEITFEEASKLKRQYSLALTSYIENDNNILLTTSRSLDDNKNKIKTSELITIIEETYQAFFEIINKELNQKALKDYIDTVILTGEGVLGISQIDRLAVVTMNLPVKISRGKVLGKIKFTYMESYALTRYIASKKYEENLSSKISVKENKNVLKKILEKIKDFFYS